MTNDTRQLSPAERVDWLRLIRSENVGPVTFYRLIERFGSAARALDALPEMAKRGGRAKPIAVCAKAVAERELAAADKLKMQVVARVEPAYPPALRAVDDAPPIVFMRGNPHLLTRTGVAIVGARNASANGRRLAFVLARDLGAVKLLVVSGMARGIDTAAHEGALPYGTAAVLAGGADHVYPAENAKLYDQIVEAGVVVSEMPPGTVPQASHFPRRNRIISGIGLGVVVVEASLRSGSLITARQALDQGREIFAVPGSPLDPRCVGPNSLIRQGATLTESADDILRVLDDMMRRPLCEPGRGGFATAAPAQPDEAELATARQLVIESLGPSPTAVDEVARAVDVALPLIQFVLLELELAGRLERQAGGKVCLVG